MTKTDGQDFLREHASPINDNIKKAYNLTTDKDLT